jgi:GT2 family glycosyltransferase
MSAAVSVVIPTHEREARLAFALDALASQTLAPSRFEVVVVRAPGAEGPLAEAPAGIEVRFLEGAERGPVPQRNAGWRAARAPLVAFADDDCRAAPLWLERLLAVAEREGAPDEAVIVQGRTEPDPDELHLLFGLARSIEVTGPTGLYETCNLLYPRQLLERLGGFDPAFTLPHWGEDTDLGLRAEEAGARLAYADDALAWHAVHPNPLPQALREARRRRRFARLLARHPRVRRELPQRLFVNESHRGMAIALAGLAAAALASRRRGSIAALAAVPYVARALRDQAAQGRLTTRRLARLALHLPARAAVDAAEVGHTIRGAIEDRTPVV